MKDMLIPYESIQDFKGALSNLNTKLALAGLEPIDYIISQSFIRDQFVKFKEFRKGEQSFRTEKLEALYVKLTFKSIYFSPPKSVIGIALGGGVSPVFFPFFKSIKVDLDQYVSANGSLICMHCGVNRARNSVLLVEQDGEHVSYGITCLSDDRHVSLHYLRWKLHYEAHFIRFMDYLSRMSPTVLVEAGYDGAFTLRDFLLALDISIEKTAGFQSKNKFSSSAKNAFYLLRKNYLNDNDSKNPRPGVFISWVIGGGLKDSNFKLNKSVIYKSVKGGVDQGNMFILAAAYVFWRNTYSKALDSTYTAAVRVKSIVPLQNGYKRVHCVSMWDRYELTVLNDVALKEGRLYIGHIHARSLRTVNGLSFYSGDVTLSLLR